MMRRTVAPSCLEKVLVSQQESRRLWTADTLAAAVCNGSCATFQVNVGNGQDLGRRVHDDGYVMTLGDLGDNPSSKRPIVAWSAQDINHSGAFIESVIQFVL